MRQRTTNANNLLHSKFWHRCCNASRNARRVLRILRATRDCPLNNSPPPDNEPNQDFTILTITRSTITPKVAPEKREHFLVPDVGHYGIFSGRRYREIIYPRMREFMRKHS